MPRPQQKNKNFQEAIALALMGLGTLLFLALISYTARDVPTWFPLHSFAKVNKVTLNFIGPFGAILACTCYSFFGVASYLISALLLGYGGAKLFIPTLRLRRRSLWALAFVLAAASLAHLLPFKFLDAARLNISGAGEGGMLGKWIGENLFSAVLGRIGALMVLGSFYLCSLLSMVGIAPTEPLRTAVSLPPLWWEKFQSWRQVSRERAEERAAERAAEKASQMVADKRAAAAEAAGLKDARRKPEKAVANAKKVAADPDEAPEVEEPVVIRPAPQIIDGTAPPPNKDRVRAVERAKAEPLQAMATLNCANYQLPSYDLLDPVDLSSREAANPDELLGNQKMIIDTLAQFGISVSPGDITRGPTITRYEVYPAKGVRVDKIVSLERDIARATRAERINILAPIPGKDTVGIEIANSKKQKVTLRELIESDDFAHSKARIPIALGKDVYGKTVIADLAAMPHGLVAGTTGSGKSVCINAIIASILYRFSPEDLRLIMIDPKVVEMQMYNALPHLVVPVVTDPKKVLLALRWAVDEMERRYAIFAKTNVRNITSFNTRPKLLTQKELDELARAKQAEFDFKNGITPENGAGGLTMLPDPVEDAAPFAVVETPPRAAAAMEAPRAAAAMEAPRAVAAAASAAQAPTEEPPDEPEDIDFSDMSDDEIFDVPKPKPKMSVPRDADELIIPDRMPYIVIIVDELADLMQTAPADVESAIARITQKARAAGLHMIIATQTPRADVITGVIKANVPCRIAFQVSSPLDSRVILDENGAERLLGQGDMLYRPPGTSRMVRAQGVLVTDEEVQRVVEHAASQSAPMFENSIHQRLQAGAGSEEEEVSAEDEELVEKCIEVMRQEKKASTSLFQRRLRLGYTRAARILDILEARGYVAAGEGAKPREILQDLDA